MPPSYVKAYLKRSKNDANDAAAICEGPSKRFVPTKSEQQQSALSNAIGLAELGIISASLRVSRNPDSGKLATDRCNRFVDS
jgi:hypothetical protein